MGSLKWKRFSVLVAWRYLRMAFEISLLLSVLMNSSFYVLPLLGMDFLYFISAIFLRISCSSNLMP